MPSNTALLTTAARVKDAQRLLSRIQDDTSEHLFVTAGGIIPWNNDSIPPTPVESIQETYLAFDSLLFGKKVEPQDATLMVPYIPWTAGVVYPAYSDQIPSSNCYVVCSEGTNYNVFKCLNNNNLSPSSTQPLLSQTSDHDAYYMTSDGYHWKFLYSIPGATYTKFATANWVPCIPNANVSSNAANGSIESIDITIAGLSYNSYTNGYFSTVAYGGNTLIHSLSLNASSNPNFYVNTSVYITSGTGAGQLRTIKAYSVSGNNKLITIDSAFSPEPDGTSIYEIDPQVVIVGDGSGAYARGLVNTSVNAGNSIYAIQVISGGSNYSYANCSILGVVASNGAGLTVANTAFGVAHIAPFGGHGSDVPTEIGATAVGISVTFANTEGGTIPANNSYRTVSLLENPLYTNTTVTYSSFTSSNTFVTQFALGEVITGGTSNAIGTVAVAAYTAMTLTGVSKIFLSGEKLLGSSGANATSNTISGPSYTVDARTRLTLSLATGTFTLNEQVVLSGTSNSIYGYVHYANTSVAHLSSCKGTMVVGSTLTGVTSGVTAKIASIVPSDILKYKGRFVYNENISPVSRSSSQSETIRIVKGY